MEWIHGKVFPSLSSRLFPRLTLNTLCVFSVCYSSPPNWVEGCVHLAVWWVNLKVEALLWLHSDCVCVCAYPCMCVWCSYSRRAAGYHCLRLLLLESLIPFQCQLTGGTTPWQVTDVWMIWADTFCSVSRSVCAHASMKVHENQHKEGERTVLETLCILVLVEFFKKKKKVR